MAARSGERTVDPAGRGIHLYGLHRPEIEQEPAVAHGGPGDVMAATAHHEQPSVLAGEIHGLLYVSGAAVHPKLAPGPEDRDPAPDPCRQEKSQRPLREQGL